MSDIVSMITSMQIGITAEIKSVKSEVTEEFKAVNQRIDHQFDLLKADVANLTTSVSTLSRKQADLTAENALMKEELLAIKKTIAIIEEKQRTTEEKHKAELQEQAVARDDIEAQQRRYNLNVSGIVQLDKQEDCKKMVNDFLKKLVPSHDPNSLDICHRTASGQLICRFSTRSARDNIYASRHLLRNMTTQDFGLPGNSIKNKLYINENLTFYRAKIHKAARSANNTFNRLNDTKHRIIIYKGQVTAATPPTIEGQPKSGKLTPLLSEESVENYFNKLK